MRKRFAVVLLAVVAFIVAGASFRHFRASAEVYRPVNPKLVAANTDFGIRLLKELVKTDKGKNVFISPASISMALSMTYNGADGSTKDAMAKTLGVQSMTLDQVNEANEALLVNLRGQGDGVEVRIANSIWARNDVAFKDTFLDTNRRYYSAEVTSLPFDSAGVSKVNSWVSDNTGGKIPAIIDRFDPADIMALVNAVYFKGEWEDAFDPKYTKPAPFTLSNGARISVPAMNKDMDIRWFEVQEGVRSGLNAPGLEGMGIPYKDGRTEMWFILPSRGSVSSLVGRLSAAEIERSIARATKEEALVSIPRFKLACTFEDQMKATLTHMGMGVAFSPGADFSRLSSAQAWIGRIIHKTMLEVDEKGTAAAAATAGLAESSIPMDFTVDHPFLCLIRDNKTKAILFIGVVEDPR